MNATATAFLPLLFLASLLPIADGVEGATTPVRFGMDASSIPAQTAAGVKPDYGVLWIGPWTLSSGWGGPDKQLSALKSAGVTPVIQFYYWGDDVTQSCLANGCWSKIHNVWKSSASWHTLAEQLADHVEARMGGSPVVIVLETEFNKNDVATYEAWDGHLAAKAAYFEKEYPPSEVVMGLGNWNNWQWATFDRTAAASTYVGLQGMRASTRDSAASYDTLYEATLAGAKKAKTLFGKPIFITDVGLSSHAEPGYLQKQADSLGKFFKGLPDLRSAGVMALVYRSWYDTPMSTANYYGEAERHWGLDWSPEPGTKAAAKVWVSGVKAERGTPTGTMPPATDPGTPTFSASFTPKAVGNDWWVEVWVQASSTPAKVEAKVNSGSWTTLPKTWWGSYAKSIHAPDGSQVVFRATAGSGATATSEAYVWGPAPASTMSATFTPKAVGNDWWVEANVKGSTTVAKVEAKVNGGSWTALPKTDWGTYAKSIHAPNGSSVVFRATATSGATATSPTYTWT